MSKELEALENMKNGAGDWYRSYEMHEDYPVVKSALQRLETIENAKPSEALECLKELHELAYGNEETSWKIDEIRMSSHIKQALLKAQEQEELLKSGDLSDGYHTFNQLYYQRCVLFASLVRLNKDKSWKSFKHSDGKYCFDSNGEWFIVGIDTPIGSYTYHYEKKYWDLFECQELECGKEWDGHTEEDVTRLLSLPNEQEKVLEIIKERKVEVNLFYTANCSTAKDYNGYIRLHYSCFIWFNDSYYLTEEEFDLLKRYCNEQDN